MVKGEEARSKFRIATDLYPPKPWSAVEARFTVQVIDIDGNIYACEKFPFLDENAGLWRNRCGEMLWLGHYRRGPENIGSEFYLRSIAESAADASTKR